MNCTRCGGIGFLNIDQLPPEVIEKGSAEREAGDASCPTILRWIEDNGEHDVQVCDCCGDGDDWHGEPGEHDESSYGGTGCNDLQCTHGALTHHHDRHQHSLAAKSLCLTLAASNASTP